MICGRLLNIISANSFRCWFFCTRQYFAVSNYLNNWKYNKRKNEHIPTKNNKHQEWRGNNKNNQWKGCNERNKKVAQTNRTKQSVM